MPRLSLIVITLNEEDSILRCLESASFADEFVVVDGGSTDRTAEIASAFGARVISRPDWQGFGPQKNRALAAATGDWILSLDADEWLEPATAAAIQQAIASGDDIDGYYIPRRSRFYGVVAKHGGWWPDYVLRLFRSNRGRFSPSLVHEKVMVKGRTKQLPHPIEHRGIVDAADAERKIALYAHASACEMASNGRGANWTSATLHGTGAFVKSYVLRLGFLDDITGLRLADYNARYAYRKWRALYDLQRSPTPVP